jgi:hypothetical protein
MGYKTGVFLLLLALLSYGAIKAVPLVQGPQIDIYTPKEHESIPEGHLTLSGRAIHANRMTLNGAPFLIDEQGRFTTTLLLPSGGAILTLTAYDRFGRSVSEQRSVFIP